MGPKFYFVLLVIYLSMVEKFEATAGSVAKIFEKIEASETKDSIHAIVGLNLTKRLDEISNVWVDFEFAEDAKVLYQNLKQSGIHDELEVYSIGDLYKLAFEQPPFLAIVDNGKSGTKDEEVVMYKHGYFPRFLTHNNFTLILAPSLPIIDFFLHQLRFSSFKRYFSY